MRPSARDRWGKLEMWSPDDVVDRVAGSRWAGKSVSLGWPQSVSPLSSIRRKGLEG